ncbi:hypothetical protein QZH41_008674, partial [Actinostola sp. cb2023]
MKRSSSCVHENSWGTKTNSNPETKTPPKLFLQGCPTRVRCDPGTENGIIGKSQMFLRRNGEDSLAGENSYYEGSSVVNQ